MEGVKSSDKDQWILGLLHTGATGIFVKRAALQILSSKLKVLTFKSKSDMLFHTSKKLHSLTSGSLIFTTARLSQSVRMSVGHHAIILGIHFIQQLGNLFDFRRRTVTWDEVTIAMHQMGSIKAEKLTNIESSYPDIPKIVQKAVKKLE
jgi:hypothetical protein